ncbi:MAG: hypothetical protein WA695_03480 [Candidatus Dormiibacterota bacterium]
MRDYESHGKRWTYIGVGITAAVLVVAVVTLVFVVLTFASHR